MSTMSMLSPEAIGLSPQAVARIKDRLRDKIAWLPKCCSAPRLEYQLGEIKKMIVAAMSLGVRGFDRFSDCSFDAVSRRLLPQMFGFRTFNMELETAELLRNLLREAGVPEEYYADLPLPYRGSGTSGV